MNLLAKYKHAFSRKKFDVGAFFEEYIDFSLITGAKPPPCKHYKVNPVLQERATLMLNALERAGCIAKMVDDYSPFISPVLFLIKKPPEISLLSGVAMAHSHIPPEQCLLRLTVDYIIIHSQIRLSRRDNKRCSWSRFPLPEAQSFIHNLSGSKWLTCTNFCQSFFHGVMEKNTSKILSFSWNNLAYEMLRLPMGIRFALSIIQKFCTKLIVTHNMQRHIHLFVHNAYFTGATV